MASRWLNSSSHRRRADSASTNPDALFDVPAGLAAFHDKVGDKGSLDCGDGAVLDTREGGYGTNGEGEDGTHYCGDKADSPSYIWFESNMDSCCDGAPAGTTGVCETDPSYLPETAYTDADDNPYDAMKIQYVVINMEDGFDATKFGVQPRSVVAVVCGKGGKMTFGVWGETNAQGSMGETSVALGRVCFGEEINGNFGYSAPDVLYIVFPGSEEETIPSGAGSDEDAMFELGQKLVAGAFGGEASSTTTTAKEDDATATASSKTATVEEGGGTSTKEATTATSKPSTTSPAASPSSGSSVDSDITSTSTETEGGPPLSSSSSSESPSSSRGSSPGGASADGSSSATLA
ncbi:hypothetical protein JCM6882_003726 [Rhodosporidiobolus microsporus]